MKSFLEHLQNAVARAPQPEAFQAGYDLCLAGMAGDKHYQLYGLDMAVPEGVYPPHEFSSTRFFIDRFGAMDLANGEGRRWLEIGSGCGAISLMAARAGWDVTAVDLDDRCVGATRANAERNGLRVRAQVSDLFSAVPEESFDVVVFNQPFYHVSREVRPEELALASSSALHARFLREARTHLAPGGRALFTYSNCSDPTALAQPGWTMQVRAFDYDATADLIRGCFQATPSSN